MFFVFAIIKASKSLNDLVSEIYDYLKEYCKGKEFKLPKKHLIRCQVRLTAKQTFNNSPWTLIDGIARQHNIVKECPANVQEIFNKHEEKKRKKLLEKQRKLEAKASKAREKALRAKEKAERQREREEKAREKANKKKNANVIDLTDSSLVNNINDNNEFENKQLKYQCDDQLLMVYKRLTDEVAGILFLKSSQVLTTSLTSFIQSELTQLSAQAYILLSRHPSCLIRVSSTHVRVSWKSCENSGVMFFYWEIFFKKLYITLAFGNLCRLGSLTFLI